MVETEEARTGGEKGGQLRPQLVQKLENKSETEKKYYYYFKKVRTEYELGQPSRCYNG